MWLSLAFLSATLLGFYDVSKKQALRSNAVIPVLFLNTLFSMLIFVPFILLSATTDVLEGTMLHVPMCGWEVHKFIVLKAFIVLGSWLFGYFGMKHLPITIVGPINATRPVLVLLGALLIFGERLNVYQWIGVLLAIASVLLLSRSGKKEGIDFRHNRWIYCVAMASLLGALSALYDKFLMRQFDSMVVQSWFTVYQFIIMGVVLLVLWAPRRSQSTPFRWSWVIPLISIFLCAADFAYYTALSQQGALIAIVSMVRRGSVLVSFLCGALLFREKNLKSKAFDLLLVLLGMLFLYWGTRG
ncbi:MAG: EamA family transporter [Bacteroidaceae bacterium]|nr:EamA family transporter [Bacteroidaceae bacterium]